MLNQSNQAEVATMSFQIHALSQKNFKHLYSMNEQELKERRALRCKVTENPGTPCRISLEDVLEGESVILTNFVHHDSESPFCASHAIYVRPEAERAMPQSGDVPDMIGSRLISVRGYSSAGFMLDADVTEGVRFADLAERLFNNPEIEYLHIHTAKLGCYLAKATRA